ncbi:hypothetical protein KKD52_13560 [Myxococcota bacterium]|nr:hypothetical protein [Myxococcota bacterium]MBU1413559.1 hypothetical protein [Myxococcota bacterium]MBU1511381.1 hypothetical protein [Myxococcota bacterium]
MKTIPMFFTLALIASLWGCQQENTVSEKFLQAAPKSYMVRLVVPGNEKNLKALGDVAESYRTTVQVTRDVNTAVLNWLLWVETIVKYPASEWDDTSSTWGPWEPDDGLSSVLYRFRMWLNTDDSFDYAFEIRPKNDAGAAFVPVYTGHVNPGGLPTLNAGTMTFDFDAAAQYDYAVDSAGTISVAYDYIAGQKDIAVTFDRWKEHAASLPVTANYHYIASAAGDGHFDFETWADVHAGTEEAAQYPGIEHWTLRSRWTPDGDGRTDVLVTGEDLTAQGVEDFRQSECWDDAFTSTFLTRLVTIPPDPVFEEVQWGAEDACSSFPAFSSPEL